MAKFDVHEPLIQAAVLEAAARLSAVRKGTAEETVEIAQEILARLAQRPEEGGYAPLP